MKNSTLHKVLIIGSLFLIIPIINAKEAEYEQDQESIIIEHSKNVSTPLHKIVIDQTYSLQDILREIDNLIASGADINARDEDLNTPLCLVTMKNGDAEIVMALVEHGADITIPDQFNVTPMHHAARCGNQKSIEYLSQASPKEVQIVVVSETDGEQTPLDLAQSDEVKNLLEAMKD